MPNANQPQFIFAVVVGIDPRVTAFLADGTLHEF
jgi:hypothetical protein